LKQRIVSILLLIFLAAPFLGTYTWLHYQKRSVRKSIKRKIIAGLDKNELVLLRFTKQEEKKKLRWEHSKEFEFENQMYDVVETKTVGDTIYYWCWWDNEETALNIQLKNLVANALGTNSEKKEKQEHLLSYLKSLYCSTVPPWSAWVFNPEHIGVGHIASCYISHGSPPNTPPPKNS
jgi:hypothetical protein